MIYAPGDWYWIVAGDVGRPWSSARASYIPASDSAYQAWLGFGRSPTPIESEDSLVDVLLAAYPAGAPSNLRSAQYAIDRHVDAIAAERGYSSAVSCASYVASTNPVYAAEAVAFVAWRDAVWVYAFAELAKVQAGQREKPTLAELVAELPSIVWPEVEA